MKRLYLCLINIFFIFFLVFTSLPVLAITRNEQDSNDYWYGEAKYPEATIYSGDITETADTNKVIEFKIKFPNHSDYSNYEEFKSKMYSGTLVFDPSGIPSNSAEYLSIYETATKDNPFGLISTTMLPKTLGSYSSYPENIDSIFKFTRGKKESDRDFIYGDIYDSYDYLLPYEGINIYLPSQPDEENGDTGTGYFFIQEGAASGTYSIDTAYIQPTKNGKGNYSDFESFVSDILNLTILPKVKALTFINKTDFDLETSSEITVDLNNYLSESDLLICLTPLFTDEQANLDAGLDPIPGYSLYKERSEKYVAGTVKRTSENGPIVEEQDVWIYYNSDNHKIYELNNNSFQELSNKNYNEEIINQILENIEFKVNESSNASIENGKITFTKNGNFDIYASYNNQKLPIVSQELDNVESSSSAIHINVSGIKNNYQINVKSTEGGTVSGGGNYLEGSSVTLTATANNGYEFLGWYNGNERLSTANPFTFKANENITLTAQFNKIEVPSTPSQPSQPSFPSTPVQPSEPGNPDNTEDQSPPINNDKIVVEFEKDNSTQGTVKGDGEYIKGEVIQVSAEPEDNYHFSGWQINGEFITDANPLPFKVTEDMKLEPIFTKNGDKEPEFTGLNIIEINKEEHKGSVIGTGKYAEGKTVTLLATPENNYEFDYWEIKIDNEVTTLSISKSTKNPYTFIAKKDTEVNAIFKKLGEEDYDSPEIENPGSDEPVTPDIPEIPSKPNEETIPVYRLYNHISFEHLFTTDLNEKNVLSATSDWSYEGIAWKSSTKGDGVYRLFSPITGNHLYTKDLNEYKILTTERGWLADNDGKPLFYSEGNDPVYRLYNEDIKQHLLTLDKNEYEVLKDRGWNQEGVALYSK